MAEEQDSRLNVTPSLSVEISPDLAELGFMLHPPFSPITPERARTLARWLLDAADLVEAEASGRTDPRNRNGGGGTPAEGGSSRYRSPWESQA